MAHVGWSKKGKKNIYIYIFPGPSVANDAIKNYSLKKQKICFSLKMEKKYMPPNTYLLQERKKKEREKVSERQGTKN